MNRIFWTMLGTLCLCILASPAFAGDWSYPSHPGATPLPIADDWNGEDIVVDADADDALYEVHDVGHGVAGNLTITSTDEGDAILTFGDNVVSVDDVPGQKPPYRINFLGDATLTGAYEPNPSNPSGTPLVDGRAVLEVKNGDDGGVQAGNIVYIHGATTVGVNAGVHVDGSTASFLTGALKVDGKRAVVQLTNSGRLRVFGATEVVNGTLDVQAGLVDFWGNAKVSGLDAEFLSKDGIISFGEKDRTADQSVKIVLENGGAFRVVAGGTTQMRNETNATGHEVEGILENASGYLRIDAGGTLNTRGITKTVVGSAYADGGITHGTEVFGDLIGGDFETIGGAMRIATGGSATADLFKVSGGVLDVQAGGRLFGTDIRVTGGTVNVYGHLDKAVGLASTLSIQGGEVQVQSGGTIATDTVEVAGSAARLIVGNLGVLAAGTELRASAGEVSFAAGSDIAGGLGGAGLKKLDVAGDAVLALNSDTLTEELAFSGVINLGASLEVKNNPTPGFKQNLSGRLNLAGGEVLFHNDVDITGRGIYGTALGGSVNLGGNSLTVSRYGRIDAGSANVAITDVGDFTLNGSYWAGYEGGVVTRLGITGMQANGGTFTVGPDAKMYMTGDLQMHINLSGSIAAGVRILDTDSDMLPPDLGRFQTYDDSTGVTYYYELRDEGAGYGLYVVGSKAKSREEQRKDIIASWESHPDIGDNVGNVLPGDFVDAIIDGNAIRVGLEGDYGALSESGQFNARVLSSLTNRKNSGYDALMLYNGSGVGMAHQAILNNNQQTLKRLSLRNQFVRREILLAGEVCDPCTNEFEELEVSRVNRVWAAGNYTSDSAGHGDGFAGYKYRGKGLTIGYDRLFDRFAAGAAFTYMGGDFKDAAALSHGSTIDTYGFHLYGNYQADSGLFVSGSLGYAYSDAQLRDARVLDGKYGWNTGDFGANSLLAAIGAGMDFALGDYLVVTPSAGFNYVNTKNSAHRQYFSVDNQAGGGGGTLNVGRITGHSATTPLDLAVSYEVYGTDDSLFVLTGNIGYAYELNNKSARGSLTYTDLPGVGPVRIATREIGRHIFNVGVNAKYNVGQFEFGAGYDYTGRNRYHSHSFQVSGGVVF